MEDRQGAHSKIDHNVGFLSQVSAVVHGDVFLECKHEGVLWYGMADILSYLEYITVGHLSNTNL